MDIECLFNNFLNEKKIDLSKWKFKDYPETLDDIKNRSKNIVMYEDEFCELIMDYYNHICETNILESKKKVKKIILKQLTKYAAKTNMIVHDFLNESTKEPNIMSIEEIMAIYNILEEDKRQAYITCYGGEFDYFRLYCSIRNKLLFEALLLLGESVYQVVGIKWQDIDYRRRTIKIKNRETDKFILIPITEEFIDVIIDYKSELGRLYNFNSNADYIDRSEYIFYSTHKEIRHMSGRGAEHIVSVAVKRAGITEHRSAFSVCLTHMSIYNGCIDHLCI